MCSELARFRHIRLPRILPRISPAKAGYRSDARNGAFEDINLAFEHQETGKVIKPLIRF